MKMSHFAPIAARSGCAATALALAIMSGAPAMAAGPAIQPRSGDPLPGLTADQLDRFFKGMSRFNHTFLAQEGLGPTFNHTSCGVCHSIPATGGAGSISVTRFGAMNIFTEEFDPLAHLGGSLHQMGSIIEDCADEIPDPSDIVFPWELVTAARITNAAFGAGLVEAIDDDDILAHATHYGGEPWTGTPPPGISNNISGHAHKVIPLEDENDPPVPRVGRMGWKAQVATVLTFSADAARNEMGITNRFIEQAPAPKGDADLLAWCEDLEGINDMAPHPNDQPHLDPFGENIEFIDRITHFQRFLAAPPQTPKSGMTGEQIFNEVGCAQCHIPSWTTRNDRELEEAIRNKEIRPYSDFLLHNMGIAGDLIEQGDAQIRFMRTPSLWGVRDRDPIWHDGRVAGGTLADRIHLEPGNNIIHWHNQFGSTAQDSAKAFIARTDCDKSRVVDFIDSLGRLEFDYDGDQTIDDSDFAALVGCYTGDSGSYVSNPCPCDPGEPDCCCSDNPMDYACAVFDIEQTATIDHTDFELFLTVYEGEQSECDLWLALADGVAPGIDVPVPPHCTTDPCPADLTGDGNVGVPDVLVLLESWGACPRPGDCPADLDGDGTVGVADLLILLANWGPCPE